jgi:aspartyl-tRNA(Asn)/glutamyl-tRNA(Gln) amidotransferase subunit A
MQTNTTGPTTRTTLARAAADLTNGRTTARALVEACLEAIQNPDGEGKRTFIRVYAEQARTSADAMDLLRRAGRAPGPYAGVPVSLKDLLDVRGEVTAAGSAVLADAAPAEAHAAVVQRVLAAGFVPVGRTNMTEFAFSGIGINPHHGTPRAPWDRAAGRVPGGSSSGAAVSVADGMALAALGTDTGGSCRIPAAFCGIVGYKPTARRVPLDGALPLSPTLDSIGPLANSVACCAAVDAILAGEAPRPVQPMDLRAMRLAVPGNIVMDGVDPAVAETFGRALNRLASQGARVTHLPMPVFKQVMDANANGGFAAAEAHAWHRALLARGAARYDPRVRVRIERGAAMTAVDLIALMAARARIVAAMNEATAPFDAVAMPTSPIVPPLIADLADDDAFTRTNALVLRNPALANFLDRCSVSLPANRLGEPPVGFMLMGETSGDARLFGIAAAIEAALKE